MPEAETSIERLEASSKLKGASPEGEVGSFETLQAKDRIAGILYGINENEVSKVVDENGEPLVVYSGSPASDITTFQGWGRGNFLHRRHNHSQRIR